MITIPTYNDIKIITDNDINKEYILFMTVIGGYIRLQVNKEYRKQMSLDYLEKGYLTNINYNTKSKYKFNKLYKVNKKNYDGLIQLFLETINVIETDCKELENSRKKHTV